jgi:hypothetical protein
MPRASHYPKLLLNPWIWTALSLLLALFRFQGVAAAASGPCGSNVSWGSSYASSSCSYAGKVTDTNVYGSATNSKYGIYYHGTLEVDGSYTISSNPKLLYLHTSTHISSDTPHFMASLYDWAYAGIGGVGSNTTDTTCYGVYSCSESESFTSGPTQTGNYVGSDLSTWRFFVNGSTVSQDNHATSY